MGTEKPTDIEDAIEVENTIPQISLKGSTWKLAGIVDIKTGTVKKLEPSNCESCYILTFDTDSIFTAISLWQRFKVDLRIWNPIGHEVLVCEAYDQDGKDYCDSDDFVRAINAIESYTVTSDELRLVTVGGYRYLSFIPHDGVNPSTSRRGTRWKLMGLVDDEIGDITEFEPQDCEECYTITFWGDYRIAVQSITALQHLDLLNLDLALDPTVPWPYDENIPLLGVEEWCKDSHHSDREGECIPYADSYLFRCGIAYTEDYEMSFDKLKLFFVYQEKKYHLLFKLVYL
jgi:hypothetical protein